MKELWVEKWRPKTLDGYVFQDESMERQVKQWVKDKSIPHLLFAGTAGIGKTTLAKILINEVGVTKIDVLELNASRTNSVDDVRDTITRFCQHYPFGPFKVVLLDEADFLSQSAQAALRGVMEEYHSFARFILTCNLSNKILPAIHSRCQTIFINRLDQTEFTARAAEILINEGVTPDLKVLDTYVRISYPDLRKCINTLQQNVHDNSLIAPNESTATVENDWRLDMVELFREKKFHEARSLICKSIRPEEISDVYTWLYQNIELFGTPDQQDSAIICIKQGLVDHSLVVDPEINLAATLVKLSRL